MDNAIGVRRLHGPRQHFNKLRRQTGDLRRAIEFLRQVAPCYILQDKIGPSRNITDIVNLNDIWMLQSCDDVGLVAKTSKLLLASLGPILKHLYCHDALQRKLSGLEDDAHSAAS